MGGIYLVQDTGSLQELTEQTYEAEAILQRLLADYPHLLAGDQVNPVDPRRWLLITREAPIPATGGGTGRWAVDHLFLDQDAVPTLVEVKRSSDSRIRREFVGQMLEYAANAAVYWPMEALREQFEASSARRNEDPTETLAQFLGANGDPDAFWQTCKHNLQAGRLRAIFVADVISPELRRIIEFLNEQMDPAEVVGIEVRQFVGQGLTALVPTVVGQTAAAQQRKLANAPLKRNWDEGSFFADLEARTGPAEVKIAKALLAWAERQGLRLWWGQGSKDGSFFPMYEHAGHTEWTISVWTYGRLEVQFQQLLRGAAFADTSMRQELLNRLNDVPGIDLPDDAIVRRPSIHLVALDGQEILDQFLEVLDWLVNILRQGTSPTATQ